MPQNLPQQILQRIVRLSADSNSQREVARMLEVSQGCISKKRVEVGVGSGGGGTECGTSDYGDTVSSVMSLGSPYTTVTVRSGCAVGKGRGWLMPASSLMMEIVARQSWYGVQSTMGEEWAGWSWWMELWTGIGASRSRGIKCCHGRRGRLDVTLCTSKTMPRPIQHVTRQPFWTNRMLRSWTGQLGVQTWTQWSMCGIKCQSGSETWMTLLPP